jgi:hypothetical protein
VGFLDGIVSLFTGGGSSSSKSDKQKSPLAASADQVAAIERNLNSLQSLIQTNSMQQTLNQQIVAQEQSSQQLMLFAALGGGVLLVAMLALRKR